jgi:hypothetical protein
MSGVGATATSSLVAVNVCFQAAAKLTSTADVRRKADFHHYRNCPMKKAADNAGGR